MEIEWDPNKATSNIVKHAVRFSDAQAVLFDPQALNTEDEEAEGESALLRSD